MSRPLRMRYRVVALEQSLQNVWSHHRSLHYAEQAVARYSAGHTDLYGFRVEAYTDGQWIRCPREHMA